MLKRRAVILECGAGRTALSVYGLADGRLQRERHAVLPVEAATQAAWLSATTANFMPLREQLGVTGPVTLVWPAHLLLTRVMKGPNLPPAKLVPVIRFELEQGIPLPLGDLTWDFSTEGQAGADAPVMIAAAKVAAVEAVCAAAESVGWQPRVILPAPWAALAAWRSLGPAQAEPAMMLTLGPGAVSLWHLSTGQRAVRAFPWRGATGDSPEILAETLAAEITRSSHYFRRLLGFVPPERIWLVGAGAACPGLAEALSRRLGLAVATWSLPPMKGLPEEETERLTLMEQAGAAALALQGGLVAPSLLPSERRRDEALRGAEPWLILAMVLLVTALLLPVRHFQRLATEAQLSAVGLERQIVPLQARESRRRADLERLAQVRSELEQLHRLQARRTVWLRLCADLEWRLGQIGEAWLDRLAVVSAPGEPLRLAISGGMLDQPRGDPTLGRMKALFSLLAQSPFVSAVEGQRVDPAQPGVMKFECILVAGSAHPL